jgi:hypothetical protein
MNIICYSNSRFLFAFSFLFAVSYRNYPLDFGIVFVTSINEEILFKFWKLFQYDKSCANYEKTSPNKILNQYAMNITILDLIMIISVLLLIAHPKYDTARKLFNNMSYCRELLTKVLLERVQPSEKNYVCG